MASLAVLPLLAACASREVPDHLRPDPPPEAVAPAEATTLQEAVTLLVGRDPLLRRPTLPAAGGWATLDPGLSAWLAVVRTTPDEVGELAALESARRGSVAVPLSRGWRLGAVESRVNGLVATDPAWAELLAWTSWLEVAGPGPRTPMSPWRWLVDPPAAAPLLAYAEGWVLRAWLDGPGIPRGAAAEALRDDLDRLADRPEGRLILASVAPEGAAVELGELARLVDWFLADAAADRDREQTEVRAARESIAQDLGVSAVDAPVALAREVRGGLAAGGGELAIGGALLAWSVERWMDGACEGCGGLDRSDGMATALRWSSELGPLSRAARVAALKQAVDRLEVELKHGRLGQSPALVADALYGSGADTLPVDLLQRPELDAGAWLALTRSVGAADATTLEEGLAALQEHLASQATAAAAQDPDEARRTLLERIARRATP